MPQTKAKKTYFSYAEILEVLNNFNQLYKSNKIKEKIDYQIWKKLKSCIYGVNVERDEKLLKFFEVIKDRRSNFYDADIEFCSFNIYNSEFGVFFVTNYYYKHHDVIYDNWEDYDSMRNMYMSSTCSGNQTKNEIVDKYNKKEKDNMKGFNFNFGPCTGDNIKMSVYGLAIQNINSEWVSYDTKSGQIMNVDLLNFDGRKFMFKIPVAIKDIAKGDIVIHNKIPMFVLDIKDGSVIAVDVRAGEEKKILPTNSPFGFNFVTKVVSMFNAFNGAPTPDAPFGNFLPFMMISEDNEIDPFVMCMMMQNMDNTKYNNIFSNPMMMYFLMKDGGVDKDFMLPMLMMQAVGQPTSEVIKSNK